MEIVGIGNDIEEVERFANKLEASAFFEKVYTKRERQYILSKKNPEQTAAGIFCAKEAFFKAFGSGILFPLVNVEVCHKESGMPYFSFYGTLSEKIKKEELAVYLAISHTARYATANVVIERRERMNNENCISVSDETN